MDFKIRNIPGIIETHRENQTIIAIGDLHGDREIFWSIMVASGCVKMKRLGNRAKKPRWIGGNTIVVALGDTVDSKRPEVKITDPEWAKHAGERQLQLDILDLDAVARYHGGMVLSILGNHDIFAGMSTTYCKDIDVASYRDRAAAYNPGGEFAKIFGETRNVIQIVGPCLFVHGTLKPDFMKIFPHRHNRDIVEYVNSTMRRYLKGELERIPAWFTHSQKFDVNPVECRDYGYRVLKSDGVKEFLKTFPGEPRFMVLGHTPHPTITRLGPVICTDVGLSRAFGEKQGHYAAEWVKFVGKKVYRCGLGMDGEIDQELLKTSKR